MTLDEYKAKIDELLNDLPDTRDEIVDLQYEYMTNVYKEFKRKAHDNIVDKIVCDIIYALIFNSSSGNVIVHTVIKDTAHWVDTRLWEEFGDMLLEAPQIYKDGESWVVDCMFGGYYCPEWDVLSEVNYG